MPDNNKSIDRFYKRSIVDRDKNLFLRVEALEEAIRAMKTGRPVSVTNIQNIIAENGEQILPSIVGGTSDPTDPAFTGIILSPSGQLVNGVLYNFALVENGVVLSGMGQDVTNNTTIIQGQDFIGSILYFDNPDLDNTIRIHFDQITQTETQAVIPDGAYGDLFNSVLLVPGALPDYNIHAIPGGKATFRLFLSADVPQDVSVRATLSVVSDSAATTLAQWQAVTTASLLTTPVEVSLSASLSSELVFSPDASNHVSLQIEINPTDPTLSQFYLHNLKESDYGPSYGYAASLVVCPIIIEWKQSYGADDITYSPSVLADWDGSTDPGNVDDALNQLAGRIKDVEDGGGGGGITQAQVMARMS